MSIVLSFVLAATVLGGASPAPGSKPPRAALPSFVDVSDAAGLHTITYSGSKAKNHILESSGNGILVLDYDRDGDMDLYFVAAHRLPASSDTHTTEHSTLYRNNGNRTFTDVSEAAGVAAAVYGHGGCIGDIDADGLPDIYVTAVGANILFRNNGDGTFSDHTSRAKVGDVGPSIGATFFDADGDGDQDLFVANYLEASWDEILNARRSRRWQNKVDVMNGPKGLPESRNSFFVNQGDGTFIESNALDSLGYSMGVVSFDYDNDGDVDLYIANDSTPNHLFRNLGDLRFEEVGIANGSAYNFDGRLQGSMGVHFGDSDGDGWFDLVVTNFARDYSTLYRNYSGVMFRDESFRTGLAAATYQTLGWGALFFDVDNDSDLDLFVANGHIYPQVDDDPSLGESYRQPNQLLLNHQGIYRDVSDQAGKALESKRSSRGAVFVDYDNDGDLDLAISNQDQPPTLLENQTATEHHWLGIQLVGSQTLGVRVEVTSGGKTQVRQSTSGGSYASHNDPRLHFGLGPSDSVERVSITWLDGTTTVLTELDTDRTYSVQQP